MLEIFAVAACYYWSDPVWQETNSCEVNPPYFRSLERCQSSIQYPSGKQHIPPNLDVTYECVRKTIPTWQRD